MPRIYSFLLFFNLVNSYLMIQNIKKFFFIIICMSITAFVVIMLDAFFSLPDEISGILYFISIGIAVSGALNYYR